MKKLLCLFLIAFVLCGCSQHDGTHGASASVAGEDGAVCEYPLLLLDATNEGNAFVLCTFVSGEMYGIEDYLYNGQKANAFWGQTMVPVSTSIVNKQGTFAFVDTAGEIFKTGATEIYCTGRVIDEVLEVRLDLREEPTTPQKFWLGSYSEIDLLPDNVVYEDEVIAVDMDGNGTTDRICWTFIPLQKEENSDWLDYTVTATRNGIEYKIVEKCHLPVKKDDLAVFAADVNLDGEAEIVVFSKYASRFGNVSVYQFEEGEYIEMLHYVIDPEP